jgi:hypothetical protein
LTSSIGIVLYYVHHLCIDCKKIATIWDLNLFLGM